MDDNRQTTLFDGDTSQSNVRPQDLSGLEKELEQLKRDNVALKERVSRLEKDKRDLGKLTPHKTFGGVMTSGDVHLNRLEVQIVDTPEFQRLRRVRQLGETDFVYPSAVHTRFEHSLGVLKIADTMVHKIRDNKHSLDSEKEITSEDEQIIRLLALLHDIGHMPYGHTIEDEFRVFVRHDKQLARWRYFVGEDSEIGRLIIQDWGRGFYQRFFRLLTCDGNFQGLEQDAYIYDIVSNTVCADMLDYLTRDCVHTNLKLDYHPRFLDYLYIKPVFNDITREYEKRLVIRVFKKEKGYRRDITSELVQLLRNRYYLGERVYYHHAKIKMGALIAGAVLRARKVNAFQPLVHQDQGGGDDKKPRTSDILYDIHEMGDDELVTYLRRLPEAGRAPEVLFTIRGAKRLAENFERRAMYEQLMEKNKSDLGIDQFDIESVRKEEPEKAPHFIVQRLYGGYIAQGKCFNRLELEERICEYLGMLSGDILVYCPDFDMAMKLAKVKVAASDENPVELKNFPDETIRNECDSIIEKHQDLWVARILVHPKYVKPDHKEYKPEYAEYAEIIKAYFNYRMFARNEEEVDDAGRRFYQLYVEFVLRTQCAEQMPRMDPGETLRHTEELVNNLVKTTAVSRKKLEVDQMIQEAFGAPVHK